MYLFSSKYYALIFLKICTFPSKYAIFSENMYLFFSKHALLTQYVLPFSKNALTFPKNVPTYFFQITHILFSQNMRIFFSKYVFILIKIYTTCFSKICTYFSQNMYSFFSKFALVFSDQHLFFKNMHSIKKKKKALIITKYAVTFFLEK